MSIFTYIRKAIKKDKQYAIYGIFYEDIPCGNAIATCAAESGEEAISFLEKAIEGKGFEMFRGPLKAVAEETDFKTSKKGMIYGYDSLSRKIL